MSAALKNWSPTSSHESTVNPSGFVLEFRSREAARTPLAIGKGITAVVATMIGAMGSKTAINLSCAPLESFGKLAPLIGPDTTGSWLKPTVERSNAIWTAQNARRGLLLSKRYQSALSDRESRELAGLQLIADQRAHEIGMARLSHLGVSPVFPVPTDDIIDAS